MPHKVNVIIDDANSPLHKALDGVHKRKRAELLRSLAIIGLLVQNRTIINTDNIDSANDSSSKPAEDKQLPSSSVASHGLSDFS
ncbi:MAG: hypothetical protein KUG81_05560 [Gammaproteobacteria bacterium]|nr:hypothetical protein [Gammaproteobacteria bacterium]